MHKATKSKVGMLLSTAFVTSALAFGSVAEAASLTGTWRGKGKMTLNSGAKETVRCRVRYSAQSSIKFDMNAKCASVSGSINQNGSLQKVGENRYSGSVYNAQYGVTASVHVRVNGSRQRISISSDKGSASISLSKR